MNYGYTVQAVWLWKFIPPLSICCIVFSVAYFGKGDAISVLAPSNRKISVIYKKVGQRRGHPVAK